MSVYISMQMLVHTRYIQMLVSNTKYHKYYELELRTLAKSAVVTLTLHIVNGMCERLYSISCT